MIIDLLLNSISTYLNNMTIQCELKTITVNLEQQRLSQVLSKLFYRHVMIYSAMINHDTNLIQIDYYQAA